MWPEPTDLVSVLAFLVLAGLLLPKRDWRSIPARLRAAAAGRRQYVFGPPAGHSELSPYFTERWFQLVHRELPRALTLGLPLHVLADAAEARGAHLRRARQRAWSESGAGLLHRYVAGELTEAELRERRRELGLPAMASKLTW